MTNLEYHALLALAHGPQYGYAIKEAIETESGGSVRPRAGSMYRMLARLLTAGLVKEAPAGRTTEPHPGLARRYYALTPHGKSALAAETGRLKGTVRLAEKRLRTQEGRS